MSRRNIGLVVVDRGHALGDGVDCPHLLRFAILLLSSLQRAARIFNIRAAIVKLPDVLDDVEV